MSPPDSISRIQGEIQAGEIPPVSKSSGLNSNALAFAERAMST